MRKTFVFFEKNPELYSRGGKAPRERNIMELSLHRRYPSLKSDEPREMISSFIWLSPLSTGSVRMHETNKKDIGHLKHSAIIGFPYRLRASDQTKSNLHFEECNSTRCRRSSVDDS